MFGGGSTAQYANVINSITNQKTTSTIFPSVAPAVPADSSSDPESAEPAQLFKKKKNKIKKDSSASGGLLHPNSVMNKKSKKKSTFVNKPADTNKASNENSLQSKGIIPSECVTGRNNSQEFIREKVSDGYDADNESETVSNVKGISSKNDINSRSEEKNLGSECLTESQNSIACEKASSARCANTQSGPFGFFNQIYKSVSELKENSSRFGKRLVFW